MLQRSSGHRKEFGNSFLCPERSKAFGAARSNFCNIVCKFCLPRVMPLLTAFLIQSKTQFSLPRHSLSTLNTWRKDKLHRRGWWEGLTGRAPAKIPFPWKCVFRWPDLRFCVRKGMIDAFHFVEKYRRGTAIYAVCVANWAKTHVVQSCNSYIRPKKYFFYFRFPRFIDSVHEFIQPDKTEHDCVRISNVRGLHMRQYSQYTWQYFPPRGL